MLLPSVLCILVLLPLYRALHAVGIESITLLEGQTLDLDCTVSGDRSSVLEWKNPDWFVIFLQDHRGLKDQRYKLINHSKDNLYIRLSPLTTDDEGLYICFHNGVTVKRRQVNILARPSRPLIEASKKRVESGKEEKLVLKCSVWGCKPPPRMTWLLDDRMEIFGDTKHHLEGHGKKYNSTSTLTVHTYNQRSTITCVIRHKSLRGGNLTTSLYLEHSELDKILNVMEGRVPTQTPSPNHGTVTVIPNTTNKLGNKSNVTEGILPLQTSSPTSKGEGWNFNATSGSDQILNVTEEIFHRQTPTPNNGKAILIPNKTNGTNFTYEEMVKWKPNIWFPVFVSVLLSALFVMVLLFVVKLWKAHKIWKKENEASEQSLENNRPRMYEDSLGQEKKTRAACWKVSKKYVIEESFMRTAKHSEGSQDSSVFEKQLTYVKETDL